MNENVIVIDLFNASFKIMQEFNKLANISVKSINKNYILQGKYFICF